jgi:SAM-dependent methyltransferase
MGDTTTTDILHRLRAAEVEVALPWLPPAPARVLELGGGDGFQARMLADRGYDVESIDLEGRSPSDATFYPVRDYDGARIPFGDRSFDAVFSSNVLEHIPHLPVVLEEIGRVLRDGGVGVHLVPSASWRIWTTLLHVPWLVSLPLRLWGVRRRAERHAHATPRLGSVARRGLVRLAMKALGVAPHGAYPNALAEVYFFRRARWERFLRGRGLDIVHAGSNHLFYTGYALFAGLPVLSTVLSIPMRKRLSRVLGGSCHVLVTRAARL